MLLFLCYFRFTLFSFRHYLKTVGLARHFSKRSTAAAFVTLLRLIFFSGAGNADFFFRSPRLLHLHPIIVLAAGLKEVIIYSSPDDKKKNRGFCFLEYESHKAASLAKRRLETGRVKVWSCDIIVDWADPQEEPDEETMAQVS